MSVCFTLAVFLCTWMDWTNGIDIHLIPEYPVVNNTVILSVTGITGTIRSFSWYKGSNIQSVNQILIYFPGTSNPQVNGNQYFYRASAFPNGSLQITDLVMTDQGNYTVQTQTDIASQLTVYLHVYVPVTLPVVTSSTSQPQENETVTLTCTTANAERILWRRGSASLPSGVTLSSDNSTVTFTRINRKDAGEYHCEAVNPISTRTSNAYMLTVYYGPENLTIKGLVQVNVGSSLKLQCAADSLPAPQYSWKFNSSKLNITEDTLQIPEVIPQDQGNYTCEVFNSVTKRSASKSVTVIVNEKPPRNDNGPDNPLGVGAIVGIVIATVLVLALVFSLIYLLVIKKERNKSSSKMNPKATENGSTARNGAEMEEPEIQYSSINFGANRAHAAPKPVETTVYAEVKRP
ncbi:cell adhesion molecule CEACAM1-like [Rhinophrynus dorsalis]